MLSRFTNVRLVLGIVVSIALLAAVACAADEPAAPSITTADVQAALKSALAEVPAAPAGPSATEIKSMVESAVASSAPAATDPADIKRMVEAAVAGVQTGVSKSDLEAAIAAQAGGQMTAMDVKKVVDSAIKALPAPSVDTGAIRPLIEQAVRASVPEATDPAEIRKMVEAAVVAATANVPSKADLDAATAGAVASVPTRGELEASIAKSISDATKGQLTASQVQSIVDRSVDALAASVKNLRADVQKELSAAAMTAEKTQDRLAFMLQGGKGVAIPPQAKPIYKYPDVPLDDDQMLRWPQKARQDIEPWKAGSVVTRYFARYTYLPPFHLTSDDGFGQGVALGYDVNEEGTVFKLNLDPDAVFHDGSPFTAAAAKASWEFASAPEQAPPFGGATLSTTFIKGMPAVIKGDASEAEGLVALDDHTLEIRLDAPNFMFPLELAKVFLGFVNVKAIEQDPDWSLHVPGIGQFEAEWNPNTGEAFITRASTFWGEPASLAGIKSPTIPDRDTRAIMYENEEIDISPAAGHIRDDPDHKLWGDVTCCNRIGGLYYYDFHLDKPPFEDPKVRAALFHAVNMPEIVSAVWNGGVETGIIQGDLPCVDPLKKPYKYDPDLARQLLAESTYGSADNLPPMVVSDKAGVGVYINTMTLMQEQWRDNLGAELITIHREPGLAIGPEVNLKRRSAAAFVPDYGKLVWDLGHSESARVNDLGWELDPEQPKIDALIDRAMVMTMADPNRCKAFIEADRAVTEAYRRIPIFTVKGGPGSMVAPWVLGFEQQWFGDWTNVPYWKIGKRDRSLYPDYSWRTRPDGN
jgi:oligopeptide transport system substrate-binding protein